MGVPKNTSQKKGKEPKIEDSSTNTLLSPDTAVVIPQAVSPKTYSNDQRRRAIVGCIGYSVGVIVLCGALGVAVMVFTSSNPQYALSQLSEYCCNCDNLYLSVYEINRLKITITKISGQRQCCLNTVEQYIITMKTILSRSKVPSETEITVANRLNRVMTKNYAISLLHESPVAAHMLIATDLSNYQDNNKITDKSKLPPVRNLMPGRSLSLCRGVVMERDRLIIQKKGLYLIYSQMYFKMVQGTNWPSGVKMVSHIVDRYNARLPNGGEEKLLQNVHTLVQKSTNSDPAVDFHTSYISGVFELNERDEVYARVTNQDFLSRNPTMNFIGLVKIG